MLFLDAADNSAGPMPLATIFGKSIGCQFQGDDGQPPGFSGWKTTTIISRLVKHNCVKIVVFRQRQRKIKWKGGLNALGFYIHRGEVKVLGEGYVFHFIFIYFLQRKMESKGGLNGGV